MIAKRITGIILALAVFVCGVNLLGYAYVSPNLENRIMWNSFYSQDEVDTVFLGSSLVFCGIDIELYESLTGVKAFSLSTGSQRLHEAYYNLIEADKRYNVRQAYLELNSMLETDIWGDYDSALVMSDTWTDTDYMKFGFNKIRALCDINDIEYYIQAFMPFTRYRAYIFDKNHILETVTLKRSESYKSYTYVNNYTDGNGGHETKPEYKGYWKTTRILKNPVCIQTQTKDTMYLTDDAVKYLKKIIKYCDKNDIRLSLFMTPMQGTAVIATEDYDKYHDSVKTVADEYGIQVYDFNLVKESFLPLNNDEFFDISHLNSMGAEKLTRLFVSIFEALASDSHMYDYGGLYKRLYNTDDDRAYFYSSYEDKLKEETPKVYGMYFSNKEDHVEMHIAASNNDDMEFKVTYRQNDMNGNPVDEEEPLQDYSKNRDFEIPADVHGLFTIYTQMQNDKNEIQPVTCIY